VLLFFLFLVFYVFTLFFFFVVGDQIGGVFGTGNCSQS
jgi:hypothetical protein